MIYLQINYTAIIEHIALTETFSHSITHARLVELNLNDPFAFKAPLGSWGVGVRVREVAGGRRGWRTLRISCILPSKNHPKLGLPVPIPTCWRGGCDGVNVPAWQFHRIVEGVLVD